jgi:hypothetical protein
MLDKEAAVQANELAVIKEVHKSKGLALHTVSGLSGSIRAHDGSETAPVDRLIAGCERTVELEAALREIIRLRIATNEGTLAKRADAIWQLATDVLQKSTS